MIPLVSLAFGWLLSPVPVPAPAPPHCDVIPRIAEARSYLTSVTPSFGDAAFVDSEFRDGEWRTYRTPEKEFALAVLMTDSCTVRLVTITKRGDALISPTGWDIEPVQRLNGIRWNEWNTEFYIRSPAHAVVIGNVVPFERSERLSQRIRSASGILKLIWNTVNSTDFRYYVPYSQELHSPEMVTAGREYLDGVASAAFDDLRARGVRSRVSSERLVADMSVFVPTMFSRLAVMEHTDLLEFALEPDRSTERVQVLLGANRDRSFGYTHNSAGAYGLMQFTNNGIRGTYDTIRDRYPSAGLEARFPDGAWDHLNAMKAAILLHDNNLKLLVDTFGESIVRDPRLEEYLAAMYNASPAAVVPAIRAALKAGSPDWSAHLPGRIKTETGGYLVKLRYLQQKAP